MRAGPSWPAFAATVSAASAGNRACDDFRGGFGGQAHAPPAARRRTSSRRSSARSGRFSRCTTPLPPPVKHASGRKTDIDRFVLARLESEGLAPVRAADQARR